MTWINGWSLATQGRGCAFGKLTACSRGIRRSAGATIKSQPLTSVTVRPIVFRNRIKMRGVLCELCLCELYPERKKTMSDDIKNDTFSRRGFLGMGSAALAAAGILAKEVAAQEQRAYPMKGDKSSSAPGPGNSVLDQQ